MSEPLKVEFRVDAHAQSPNCRVVIDGHDITHHVTGLSVHAAVSDQTLVTIALTNVDVVADIDSECIVIHGEDT